MNTGDDSVSQGKQGSPGKPVATPKLPTCEILTIGNEILLGQIQDTNSQYLGRELSACGVTVRFRTAVGDALPDIEQALRIAVDRADLAIVTGGLGPTLDDLTRDAVASVAEAPLQFRQELMEQIEHLFRVAGYQMPENNRRQAYVPSGSRPIPNPVGTAPGFIAEVGGKPTICLPGVPRELRYLMTHEVLPWIRERFGLEGHLIHSRVLKTVGIGESRVDELLGDLIGAGANPQIGLMASQGEIKISIAVKAGSPAEAMAMILPLENEISRRLGDKIYGKDDETLEKAVERLLAGAGWTLAILETFTGGKAAERLHALPSPQVIESRVVPDRDRVMRLAADLAKGAEAATALATGLRKETGADWALVILGSPGPAVGRASLQGHAVAAGKGPTKTFSWQMGGDIQSLQERGAVIGLNTLRLALLEASDRSSTPKRHVP